MELTSKELTALQEMLQTYREFEEEKYNYPEDLSTLFTETQRRLFKRFDITSIKYQRD